MPYRHSWGLCNALDVKKGGRGTTRNALSPRAQKGGSMILSIGIGYFGLLGKVHVYSGPSQDHLASWSPVGTSAADRGCADKASVAQ